MTVDELGFDSVTVKTAVLVPLLPSTTVASLMEIAGGASSLVMVTVFVVFWPSVAPDGALSVTVKSSSASSMLSPLTLITTLWLMTPGANVSTPLAAV